MKNKMKMGLLSICIALFLTIASAVPSSYAATGPRTSTLNSVLVSPAITKHTYYNWAGYAVSSTSAPVTLAQGSWIEPSVMCNSSAPEDQAVVFWVGIDGLTSGTVEQTGTLAYCVQGQTTPEYYAWYEFYPAQDIITVPSMKVTPGDVFNATIIGYSDTRFKVTLVDVTTGAHFTKTQPSGFSGSRTSAECITETPSGSYGYFLIPDFGTSKWGMDYTNVTNTCSATIGGKTKPIGSYGSNSWELTACSYPSCNVVIMQPSSISKDKTSFTLTWKNEGP